jgi:hypothetical protein
MDDPPRVTRAHRTVDQLSYRLICQMLRGALRERIAAPPSDTTATGDP